MSAHLRSKAKAVATEGGSTGGDGSSDVLQLSSVAGMAAHNRRLATIWRFGNDAAPICKLSVAGAGFRNAVGYLRLHWVEDVLHVKDYSGSTKATLEGFTGYAKTDQPFDPALQKKSTLLIPIARWRLR